MADQPKELLPLVEPRLATATKRPTYSLCTTTQKPPSNMSLAETTLLRLRLQADSAPPGRLNRTGSHLRHVATISLLLSARARLMLLRSRRILKFNQHAWM